jgi:hypothetical protein
MGHIAIFSIVVYLKSTVRVGGVIRKDPHSFELLYPGPGSIIIKKRILRKGQF